MKLNVITNQKEKKRNKSVLLFSGGMDSIIIEKLLNPDILLFINAHSQYDSYEKQKIMELVDKNYIDKNKLIILDDVINLKQFERDDLIIPNRNAYFILLASHFGETIFLGSVNGDRSFDKDEKFFSLMKNLLNHIWQEQHWTEERKFNISAPFKNYTKTELVEMFLKKGNDPQILLDSYSCYSGDKQPCGVCKPCVRKYVALINNDIEIPENYFKNDPFSAEWIYKILPLMKEGKYRGKEDFDFIKALKKRNKI